MRDLVQFPSLVNTIHVARAPSIAALQAASRGDRHLIVLSQRDMAVENPGPKDLFEVGTLVEIMHTIPLPDGSFRVGLRGLQRVRSTKITTKQGTFFSEYDPVDEREEVGTDVEALIRVAAETFTRVVELNPAIPPESLEGVLHAERAGLLADTITHHLPLRPSEKQTILESTDTQERLSQVVHFLGREIEILELKQKVIADVERELGTSQREYFLREQLRVVRGELEALTGGRGEIEEYERRIEASKLPPDAHAKVVGELRRLERAPAQAADGLVIRTYLDTLLSLPWNELATDRLDLAEAASLLDKRHHGLPQVKERVLDHLAVCKLTGRSPGSILCFAGPPGVGKTSIAKSIAEAMGRPLVRIALGGVRDESEIRGHRRTYVGSMPGRLIDSLRQCGVRNPVILLDELDKLGQGPQGDPTSALLEALDSGQNRKFQDHYLEVPFDLSDAIFIATANVVERIPGPLRDRLEFLEFSAYSERERFAIAKEHLWPSAVTEHGLDGFPLQIEDEALWLLIRSYTREAGVRSLNRKITGLCRRAARGFATDPRLPLTIDADKIKEFLGPPPSQQLAVYGEIPGVSWALVVSELGGGAVPIEAALVPTEGPRATQEPRLTGNLGHVMRESALAAITFLSQQRGGPWPYETHLHVPEGAVPKDGPSAGLAMFAALASASAQRPIRAGVAFTGEITLHGLVISVGGIREKVLAAIALGFKELIVPASNEPELSALPDYALEALTFHRVDKASQVLEILGFAP